MQVESKGSGIFGSSNQTRRDKDGGREGERYTGLAKTKMYQGHAKVSRIGELLSFRALHP